MNYQLIDINNEIITLLLTMRLRNNFNKAENDSYLVDLIQNVVNLIIE